MKSLQVSVIIPVWNGESVIQECLHALTIDSSDVLLEIICVDNASTDGSAQLISDVFPNVKLLRQPVNLGFAGGINAGVAAAQGDLLVLLNQDCFVHSGWLDSLVETFMAFPDCGIAGCTILNADDTVNHAGAFIKRPGAHGIHLTEIDTTEPVNVDYVTGAAFAIRRTTWAAIGPFDERYYPAYYEESDYCYRARRHGYEVRYVPSARVSHFFSGREWQADPIKHASNQHQSRYRFVCKQFNSDELSAFFVAELADIAEEIYIEHVIGRLEGTRQTLRTLPEIVDRRALDSGTPVSTTLARQLSVGFADIWRHVNDRAIQLTVGVGKRQIDTKQLFEAQRDRIQQLFQEIRRARKEAQQLRQHQEDILDQIYLRPSTTSTEVTSTEVESTRVRLVRLLIKRPTSILSGRDYVLRAELNVLQATYMEQTEYIDQCLHELLELTISQMEALTDQQQLLRLMTKYEHR